MLLLLIVEFVILKYYLQILKVIDSTGYGILKFVPA